MNYVIVGTGRMGKNHILAAHSLGLTLAGICDRSDARMEEIASEFSLTKDQCFTQPETMFDAVRAPLTVIATTADCHADLVVSASRYSHSILCEKPMATSLHDAERMIDACDSNNVRLAINHQMRFMERYSLIRDELNGGRFGRLGSMNVVAGNFGFAMNGSHYFEAFRYLTDSNLRSVAALFSPKALKNPRGPQFCDAAGSLMCVAESGQHFLLSAGEHQGHGLTVTYATQWGHIFCDELAGRYSATVRKPEHREQPSNRYGMPSDKWERTFPLVEHATTTASVLRELLDGQQYPDGQDGLHAIACVVAAHKSNDQHGKPSRLDDLADYTTRVFPWA